MPRKSHLSGCLALAAAAVAALPAQAANWQPLRKDKSTTLSLDEASIRRKGDQVSFTYMLDHAQVQGYLKTGVFYRSLVIRATVRCKPRTIALGTTEAYGGETGTGVLVGAAQPSRSEARFSPIEAGTSDQELWSHVCARKEGGKAS
jgi:hypothetical protein